MMVILPRNIIKIIILVVVVALIVILETLQAQEVEPKPNPKVEPKPNPKVEPKPNEKVEPKPNEKVEPNPCRKPEYANDWTQLINNGIGNIPVNLKYSWESEISESKLLLPTQGIPKIIHQSWKSNQLPGHFKSWSKIWKEKHKDFKHILWTDDDNRLFVYRNYPWFLAAYDMMPRKIMRIDIARCLYLHKYGGLYVDLDMLPVKPNHEVLELHGNEKVLLGQISLDFDWEHNIPNAWMASAPGHDFWLTNVNIATQRAFSHCGSAEVTTGPVLIFDIVHLYAKLNRQDEIKLLEPGLIYGVDWRRGGKCDITDDGDLNCIKEFYPKVVAYTSWSHSWE